MRTLNQEIYRKLVSGERTGIVATFVWLMLRIIACPYSVVVRLRNWLYSSGVFKVHPTSAAVISIGNLTTGGTGKTPLVVWLCNLLARDYRCAILTRGYKTARGPLLDEPAILAQSCPQAKVVVNPDRVAGAAEAIGLFAAEVLVMDDGFQHRRLARDIDIVAVDATNPFGYGRLLPAGLLREPVRGLRRAHAAVITRCDQLEQQQLAHIEQEIRNHNPSLLVARATHAPLYAVAGDGSQIALDQLKGKDVLAFCGIGNPDAFFATIEDLGARVVETKTFDDHHHYTAGCIDEICELAAKTKATLALTTQKDWTRLVQARIESNRGQSGQEPLQFAYLSVEIRFLSGASELTSLIRRAVAAKISQK